MPTVIDVTDDITAHLAAIRSAGVATVFGYLSSINEKGGKCWTPARVKAAAAAGLRIGLVHEGWGGVAGKGISATDGDRDGTFCRFRAVNLGAPKGACVYFACDRDFSAAEIEREVLPYFRAIHQGPMGDRYFRIGVYGSGAVCSAVIGQNLADLSWLAQSKGWAGYAEWRDHADLVQGAEGRIAGVDADPDTPQSIGGRVVDIGDFVPFTAAPSRAAPAPVSQQSDPAKETAPMTDSNQMQVSGDVKKVTWLAARLEEKTTYAGVGIAGSVALALAARYLPWLADVSAPELANAMWQVGSAIGGLMLIVVKEQKS